jgi:DNA-binding transcriptional LysR family regulator
MAELDIFWLGVFVEIYKARSVSLAGERLGIAQARVSGILTKLRRYFGDPLFARTSRGMEPTPYADRVYPDILRCVEQLSSPDSHRNDFEPITAKRQFRICMTDISEIVVLPALINDLRRLAPNVTIEAEHIFVGSANRMESGDVDLAVGYMPSLEAGFYQQRLFRQGFVCLAASNHSRIRQAPTRQEFCKEGHIVVATSGTGHSIADRAFQEKGLNRNIVLRVPSFLSVVRLVATTELLATVPRRLGEVMAARENVAIFPTPVPLPSYDVKLHWHARYHTDQANQWLRNVIAKVLKT